jgi:hypothetical protein
MSPYLLTNLTEFQTTIFDETVDNIEFWPICKRYLSELKQHSERLQLVNV